MQNIIEKVLKSLEEKIEDKNFMERHKREPKDFTRKSPLGFKEIIHFVIGNLGTTLDFEVLNFTNELSENVTPSAVSQARDKIKYGAFEEILRQSGRDIAVENTYCGYRLTAYDGMKGELPRTAELMEKGQVSEKCSYPQFHALAEYDVLNCCYTNAMFELGAADERASALKLLEKHEYTGKEIFLYDRGFPSLAMIQELEKSGKNYVMRVSKSFLREVNEFGESSCSDEVIEINYDKRRGQTSRLKNVELPYIFKIRCVKIELSSGETEVLITNLNQTEFSRQNIGELYNLRWGIETGFLHLKYAVCIEDFMGVKENSIKQEFFASLFKANLFMQFVDVSNDIIFNKKNRLSTNTRQT
jgi:hypothetical protein